MNDFKTRQIIPPVKRVSQDLKEAKLVSLISPEHDTEQWHQLRREGIGSSDAPAILGLSNWKTAVDIWKEKRGVEVASDNPISPAYAWFGNWFERHILTKIYQEENKRIIEGSSFGQLSWNHWEVARANIDGMCTTDGTIEEVKTTSKEWSEIPTDYYVQVQHQIMVTGVDNARIRQFICPVSRVHLYSLYQLIGSEIGSANDLFFDENDPMIQIMIKWILDIGEIVTWEIKRDDEFIERLYHKEYAFWQCVQSGEEPEIEVDGELTADLSENEDIGLAFADYAQLKNELLSYQKLLDKEKTLKNSLRQLIELSVGVSDDNPKRITCGPHKATLTSRGSWNLYPHM